MIHIAYLQGALIAHTQKSRQGSFLRQVSEFYLKTKISSNSDLDILPVASLKLVLKMNLKFGLAAP
jgi:hypothetical protein